MRPRAIEKLVGGTALALTLLGASAEETLREWHSKDGIHTIEASLTSFNSITNVVTLTKGDSTTVDVALSKLSAADQSFVRSQETTSRNESDPVKLYGITWQPDLKEALSLAKEEITSAKNRPVMWFRVLGKLDDGM